MLSAFSQDGLHWHWNDSVTTVCTRMNVERLFFAKMGYIGIGTIQLNQC
jgi:hypothetical protein